MDSNKKDYGLQALTILAQYHSIAVSPEELKHKFDLHGKGLGITEWLLAAKSLELKAKLVKKSIERLEFLSLPVEDQT